MNNKMRPYGLPRTYMSDSAAHRTRCLVRIKGKLISIDWASINKMQLGRKASTHAKKSKSGDYKSHTRNQRLRTTIRRTYKKGARQEAQRCIKDAVYEYNVPQQVKDKEDKQNIFRVSYKATYGGRYHKQYSCHNTYLVAYNLLEDTQLTSNEEYQEFIDDPYYNDNYVDDYDFCDTYDYDHFSYNYVTDHYGYLVPRTIGSRDYAYLDYLYRDKHTKECNIDNLFNEYRFIVYEQQITQAIVDEINAEAVRKDNIITNLPILDIPNDIEVNYGKVKSRNNKPNKRRV